MKNIFVISIIFFILAIILFSAIFNFAFANENTLEYPDFLNPNITKTPEGFIRRFYNYLLGIAGVLAVIMIVYGGVMYISFAGNESKLNDAKDIILNAVFGIILLAGAYIILNTINPDIVKLKNPAIYDNSSMQQFQNKNVSINMDNVDSKSYFDKSFISIFIFYNTKINNIGNYSNKNLISLKHEYIFNGIFI